MLSTKDCYPSEFDQFKGKIRTAHVRINEQIDKLGKLTTYFIRRCFEEDENLKYTTFISGHTAELKGLFEAWKAFFMEHFDAMVEICHLKTVKRVFTITLGSHIFGELTRIFLLMNRPNLILIDTEEEMESLEKTTHSSWVKLYNLYDISGLYTEDEIKKDDKDENAQLAEAQMEMTKLMWIKPIYRYTQAQAMHLAIMLTHQLANLRVDCLQEFRVLFEQLWVRCGLLLQEGHNEKTLDVPHMRAEVVKQKDLFVCNRDFYVFITYYLGSTMRRLEYFEMLKKRQIKELPMELPELTMRVKKWVHGFVANFADEAFEDMYVKSCVDSYGFIGDDLWFKYKYGKKVHSRGTTLEQLRPHMYRRYHTEDTATKEIVLQTVGESHISAAFILEAISAYIQMRFSTINWLQAVIVSIDDVTSETTAAALMKAKCPYLLQVLSGYWIYYQTEIYICDNIYESIALWFYLLQHKYASKLHGIDFSYYINEAIGHKKEEEEEEEFYL